MTILITFDTDYMSEEDLVRFFEQFEIPGESTYFLWKPYKGLSLGSSELQPHPFFKVGEEFSETIEKFESKWERKGTFIRPHSLVYSHMLGTYLHKSGYKGISQATYLGNKNISPYRHPWGIWELPIYYMESMAFVMSENWSNINYEPFSESFIKDALDNPDRLFVFAFHPLHIALNTNNFKQYQSVKEKIVKDNISPFSLTFKGKGTKDFFEKLILGMKKYEMRSVTCSSYIRSLDASI